MKKPFGLLSFSLVVLFFMALVANAQEGRPDLVIEDVVFNESELRFNYQTTPHGGAVGVLFRRRSAGMNGTALTKP